jgi:hypothetical protein
MKGCQALIHLAAVPHPLGREDHIVRYRLSSWAYHLRRCSTGVWHKCPSELQRHASCWRTRHSQNLPG